MSILLIQTIQGALKEMGLAASQGRLLSLTARNHDLVYEAQQISQQRLFLAEATREAADKYNKAMNNTVMQATINGEKQQLTYDILTSQDPFSGLCMRLVDNNGNVVVPPAESLEIQQTVTDETTGETSKQLLGRFTSTSDFINARMSNLSEDEKSALSSYSLADISAYYNNNYADKDENISVVFRNKSVSNTNIVKSGESVLYDENIYDPKYLQQMIVSGEFKIQQAQPDGSFEDLVWQGSTTVSEVLDTSDDAAAEAEYEAAMIDLQKQDKILELRLEQVETQQKAVSTEYDSVKSIIKENVEDSFKTFA